MRGPLGCYSLQEVTIRWTFHMKTAEGLVTGLQRWARGVLNQPLPAPKLLFSFWVREACLIQHEKLFHPCNVGVPVYIYSLAFGSTGQLGSPFPSCHCTTASSEFVLVQNIW
jgi:hypothetical protein